MATSPGLSDGMIDNFTGTFDMISANVTPSFSEWTFPSDSSVDITNAFVTELYPRGDADVYNDTDLRRDRGGSGIPFGKEGWQKVSGKRLVFFYEKDALELHVLGGVIVLLMALTLAGNAMVCIVSAPKIWSGSANPLNVLVFSLAIADMFKVLVDMLPKTVEFFALQWVLGQVMCKLHSMLRSTFTEISIATLSLISFERFRSIDKPSGASFSMRSLSVAMVTLWLWNLACSAPLAQWFNAVEPQFSGTIVCSIRSKDYTSVISLYVVVSRFINFFTPLVTSWICYMGIIYKTLRSRAKVSACMSDHFKRRQQILSRRVTVTCFCLVVLFTVGNTPFQFALLVLPFGTRDQQSDVAPTFKYLWLASLLQCTANPFLYGMIWENFRKSVTRFLRPCKKHKNRVAQASVNTLKVTNSSRTGGSCDVHIPHPKPRGMTLTVNGIPAMRAGTTV